MTSSENRSPSRTGQRIQKIMAAAGLGSRRACEEMIRAGRVTVDGHEACLGDTADPRAQSVEVDGVRVRPPTRTLVYLLNKPRGHVTTTKDEAGRPTVTSLVPAQPRVFPVGRLDRDTEGLILLTNDGDLSERVAHPRWELEKTYVATVDGVIRDATLRRLRAGVQLTDGPANPIRVRILARRKASTLVEVVISEGRNRIVRRLLDAVGHPVRRLVRVAIGPIRDDKLAPGKWRRLSQTEVTALESATVTPNKRRRRRAGTLAASEAPAPRGRRA